MSDFKSNNKKLKAAESKSNIKSEIQIEKTAKIRFHVHKSKQSLQSKELKRKK